MEQLVHLNGIQPSVPVLQQQAGADNFIIMPKAEYCHQENMVREQFAKDIDTSAINRGAVDGKTILRALHGCCVETSKLVIDHDLNGELKEEEKFLQSQDELRQLSVQLLTIQENERRRIAADLHDGIGQSLSLIKMSMESVAQLINTDAHEEAVESLQQMIHKVKDTITELRRTTTDLRPSMLDDLGIIPTLSWFFREFETVWRDKKIEKDISVTENDIPVPLKTTIYRILQEAMNNIVKHANANRIKVSLRKTNGILQFSIEDNGQGFDPAGMLIRHGSGRGMGLLTMKERARSSDGFFEMKSTPGQGTRIQILWRHMDDAVEGGAEVFEVFQDMRFLQPAIAL
jgi:signal transduction histidine kinase